MSELTGKLFRTTYQRIAKPIIFKFTTPEGAHHSILKIGKFIQQIPLALRGVKWAFSYENPEILGQGVDGIYYTNPIGLAAGFDKDINIPLFLQSFGFGFIEGGSVTYRPYQGNMKPWYHRLPNSKSIVVHAGMPNHGVREALSRISKTKLEIPLNLSIGATNDELNSEPSAAIEDYVNSIKLSATCDLLKTITINISCPNASGGELFTRSDYLSTLLDCVDQIGCNKPIYLKMPLNIPWSQFDELLDVAAAHQVSGVTVANLVTNRTAVEEHIKDPLSTAIKGGLSGRPTFERSNYLIRKAFKNYGKRLTIVAVGGVFSAKDAYTKIRSGASLVELISGLIFAGPQVIGEINRGLAHLLKKDGFSNVSQAIGVDAYKDTKELNNQFV